MFIYRLYIFLY